MTTDIVERLRFLASGQDDTHSVAITEAADEIERLRTAMREAKTAIGNWPEGAQAMLHDALAGKE